MSDRLNDSNLQDIRSQRVFEFLNLMMIISLITMTMDGYCKYLGTETKCSRYVLGVYYFDLRPYNNI